MTFTYDLNEHGCLILRADALEREELKTLRTASGEFDSNAEAEALESLIANSELDWIAPEDIGALTSAPILGIRNASGAVSSAWGFMDYQLRSLPGDCRQFHACPNCGDCYTLAHYSSHIATCTGQPSSNIIDEEEA